MKVQTTYHIGLHLSISVRLSLRTKMYTDVQQNIAIVSNAAGKMYCRIYCILNICLLISSIL